MSYTVWLDCREKITKEHLTPGSYRVSCSFEGFTGADLIITPLKSIISQATIQEHLDAGAVMIQIKHGLDMTKSITDQRLFEALGRMRQWNAEPYQCGLLRTGLFEKHGNILYVNKTKASVNVVSYEGSINSWTIRGGGHYETIMPQDIQAFVDRTGSKLFTGDPFFKRNTTKPRKKFKVEKKFTKGMSLQQKRRMLLGGVSDTDMRHLLINIDGLSNSHVVAVWRLMQRQGLAMNMISFTKLAESDQLLTIKGIGPKINQKIKEQLGL